MQKLWSFATLATVALVATVTATTCSVNPNRVVLDDPKAIDLTSGTINIPHEWDCTKYYTCRQGACTPMECPPMKNLEKMHFNPEQQMCDQPQCAFCTTEQVLLESVPNDCSKYEVHVNGKIFPKTCPRGLYFNEQTEDCVAPEFAGCQYTIAVPYPGNCGKFYEITNGTKTLSSCPNETHFSPAKKTCVPRTQAECSGPNGPCDDIPDGDVIVDETSCSKYIVCHKGKPEDKECPKGLYLNVNERTCVAPEVATCALPIIVANKDSKDPKYWMILHSVKVPIK